MKENEGTANKAIAVKSPSMQRAVQLVHRVAMKSCRRAFQLFCCPIDTLLSDKYTYCPVQPPQLTENKTTQVELRSAPSTILIVNINNSTLVDCVIGNNTYPSAEAESRPLMQEPELDDQTKCSYSHGQEGAAHTPPSPAPSPPLFFYPQEEPPSINIHSSHLNCVIIGDNNYMHAEQVHRCEGLATQS